MPASDEPRMPRVCAATFRKGGKSMLRCGRCKATYYVSREAQKAHWGVHKVSCRAVGAPERASIARYSLPEVWQRLYRQIEALLSGGLPDATMPLLLVAMRRLYDTAEDTPYGDGVADAQSQDIETESHTATRTLSVHIDPATIKRLWAVPGMTQLLLAGDDLLTDAERKQRRKEQGRAEDEAYYEDEEPELLKDCDAAYKFAWVYYNLIVGAAVKAQPSMSSTHDGLGVLRDGPLARAALHRALGLWSDPLVRAACRDAIAPGASLAMTAVSAALGTDFWANVRSSPGPVDLPESLRPKFVVALLEESSYEEERDSFFSGPDMGYSTRAIALLCSALKTDFWTKCGSDAQRADVLRVAARIILDNPEARKPRKQNAWRGLNCDDDDDDEDEDYGHDQTPSTADIADAVAKHISTRSASAQLRIWNSAALDGAVNVSRIHVRAFILWLTRHVAVRRHAAQLALLRLRCPLPHVEAAVAAYLAEPLDVDFLRAAQAWDKESAYCFQKDPSPQKVARTHLVRRLIRHVLPKPAYDKLATTFDLSTTVGHLPPQGSLAACKAGAFL